MHREHSGKRWIWEVCGRRASRSDPDKHLVRRRFFFILRAQAEPSDPQRRQAAALQKGWTTADA
jgi:hypothetical protein